MNRKNLTAAVLAGLAGAVGIAGSAQAVNINPGGTGQVLLYPYYTTNADNFTLLSVVNTSEDAKAVKVRFLESENSQEVLDFNLYMSAFDVWTAAVLPQPEGAMDYDCDPAGGTDVICGGPVLEISPEETTCTVPDLNGMQSFLPFQFANDGGTQDHSRMNQGHIEMIEMGVLIEDEWAAVAATHTTTANGWEPADCASLTAAWTEGVNQPDGAWIVDSEDGVSEPTGGLFGGGALVNVSAGAMHTYNAGALNGWSDTGFDSFGAHNHSRPGDVLPGLQSGDRNDGSVFTDTGSTLSADLPDSLDAVSYVLMQESLMNEYVTGGTANGQTEWVVTFPTKREYVDTQNPNAPERPFTTAWAVDTVKGDTLATACETVELLTMWDREERTEILECDDLGTCPDANPPVVSPRPPGVVIPPSGRVPFELCYETNVIRFGMAEACADDVCVDVRPDATEILGATEYLNFDNERLGFHNGWARIELDDYLEWNGVGYDELSRDPVGNLEGLPVIGFAVQRFSNAMSGAGGTPSMYGGLFTHRSSRKISSGN